MRKPSQAITAAFYKQHEDVERLLAVAETVCARRTPIFGATFAAEDRLNRILRRLSEGRPKLRGFLVSGSSPYLVSVPFRTSSMGKGLARGFLWQTKDDALVHLLALKDDFACLLREFRRYLLTDLTQVYLQTSGFKRCFDHLVAQESIESLSVSDYTAWVMTDESKRAETRRVWLPEPLDHSEFFDKLEEEDQRIRSLGVRVLKTQEAQGRVRRDLTFTCEAGFQLFFQSVIAETRRIAAETRGLFVNRGANTSPTRAPRPLQISYATPVFEDKKQNHRLINVLRGLQDSALSVFHPNPYLHASLIDYADGSSYTIWITDNSSISIVPELKASAGSLERLCNHIAECFGEGVVEEIVA